MNSVRTVKIDKIWIEYLLVVLLVDSQHGLGMSVSLFKFLKIIKYYFPNFKSYE